MNFNLTFALCLLVSNGSDTYIHYCLEQYFKNLTALCFVAFN